MEIKGMSGWMDPLARLREALARDEFALFGQAVHALEGGAAPAMVEVLVRLREEERALLPPGDFLPAFEHFGMLPLLDAWVLRCLLRGPAKDAGDARFAVNVSAPTFSQTDYVRLFAREARAAGVDPARIFFEIEESDLAARPEAARGFAGAIHAAGGGIVVGSFGRKLLSFGPLHPLRPAFVKVDGSIVRRCRESDACLTKLSAIARAGRALGMGIVAECVEDDDVLAQLREAGVPWGQGFGLSRPAPLAQALGAALAIAA